jgi:hypothetical protein
MVPCPWRQTSRLSAFSQPASGTLAATAPRHMRNFLAGVIWHAIVHLVHYGGRVIPLPVQSVMVTIPQPKQIAHRPSKGIPTSHHLPFRRMSRLSAGSFSSEYLFCRGVTTVQCPTVRRGCGPSRHWKVAQQEKNMKRCCYLPLADC